MSDPSTSGSRQRHLPVWGLIVLIVVYLAVVQGLSLALTANIDVEYAAPTTLNELWRSISVGVGASLVFVYLIVAVLRWWRPVFVDDRPVQRWVRWLPLVAIITIVGGTNWAGLADRGITFSLALLGTTLMVGFAEEGMFRGIAVTTFRQNGFTEGKVALWSTVLFGLAHATNVFSEGPKVALQVAVTMVAGYFFYLIRRWSGGLAVPALIHGFWDFGMVSAGVVPHKSYAGPALFLFADLVMLVIVLVHRHRVEPAATGATAPA